MLRTAGTRVLDDRDVDAVLRLLGEDAVANVMVSCRVEAAGLEPWRLGAEVWGYHAEGRLAAVCYSGANLVPVGSDATALKQFAARAKRQGRRCSSIVGEADLVLGLWHHLIPAWGEPREVREEQPLMCLTVAPSVAPEPGVRVVHDDELELLLPAAVAMYTEEIGVAPVTGDRDALYRARVAGLIRQRRAFALVRDGRVVFKAEVGATTGRVCQIQGVWVEPEQRGRGLGTAGTAAVVALAQARIAPVVSLYVNAHNVAARRAYARVGFTDVGTFASVLF